MTKSKIPTLSLVPVSNRRTHHSHPDAKAKFPHTATSQIPQPSSSGKPGFTSRLAANGSKKTQHFQKRIPDHAMTLAAMELGNFSTSGAEHGLIPHGPEPFNVPKKNSEDDKGPDCTSSKIDEQVFLAEYFDAVRSVMPAAPSTQQGYKIERNIGNIQLENPVATMSTPSQKAPESRVQEMPIPSRNEKKATPDISNALPDVKVTALSNISEVPRYAVNVPINILENKTIRKIFAYLNPSDLLVCRQVQRHWNALISQEDSFLDRIVFVVNIDRSYYVATKHVTFDDVTARAQLPFRHARFQYIDNMFLKNPKDFNFRNSDNEKYAPRPSFFQSLSSIEFRNCFLLWKTIKSYLVQGVCVTSLKFSNCTISGFVPASSSQTVNEFDEFKAGNAMFALKSLEINETTSLDSITSILRKVNGYDNQSLESLRISYHPQESKNEDTVDGSIAEARDLHRELKTIISACSYSLRTLFLDIQHDITLDIVGHDLGNDLAQLGSQLNLIEFQLSPPLNCWLRRPKSIPNTNVIMSMKSLENDVSKAENEVKIVAGRFMWFLESQRNLETLGLPYLKHPDSNTFFNFVLRGLPCATKLKYLAVPSASFLADDLFHVFPNLKKIKIGDNGGITSNTDWSLFQQYTRMVPKPLPVPAEHTVVCTDSLKVSGNPTGAGGKPSDPKMEMTSDAKMMNRVESLAITCTALPSNFEAIMRSMNNLAHLEVNSGYSIPMIKDEELQFFIKHLTKLRTLIISCADKLTDYGLTGIPAKNCKIMFQNQLYQKGRVNPLIWSSEKVTGRPLSDLKGLRKLVLIGNGNITDIGIAYGLAFKELKYCYLPYSDYIMEWGIKRFSENNPSLESVTFTGLNQFGKEEFKTMRKNHERVKQGDTTRCEVFVERQSPFRDYLIMGFPSREDTIQALGKIGIMVRAGAALLMRPLTMEFYTSS